jgi:hypothetical protein
MSKISRLQAAHCRSSLVQLSKDNGLNARVGDNGEVFIEIPSSCRLFTRADRDKDVVDELAIIVEKAKKIADINIEEFAAQFNELRAEIREGISVSHSITPQA